MKNFPDKYKNKIIVIKTLLRKKIFQEKKNVENKIRKPFTILIIGGSQGAEFFDNEISRYTILSNSTPDKLIKEFNKYNIKVTIENNIWTLYE